MSEDPYRPPEESPVASERELRECPECGATLEHGQVRGSLWWYPANPSLLDRFVGGKRAGGTRSGTITLGQPRLPAMRCSACHLIQVRPEK